MAIKLISKSEITLSNLNDGSKAYFYTAWANSHDGTIDFTTINDGTAIYKYMGTYASFETEQSLNAKDYTWTKVLGENGVGIESTKIMFTIGNTSSEIPVTGWTEDAPEPQDGKFFWSRTTIQYTDGTSSTSYSVARSGADGSDGHDGIAGKDGVGITDTIIEYAAYTSGTTTPTTWSKTIPTVKPGEYLWTRTTWKYTDGTSEVGYSISRSGIDGHDGIAGKDGVGISKTEITFAQSSSGTIPPTTGWTAQVPTITMGQYLWTKVTWTYTDNTTEDGYSVAYNAKDGSDGFDGKPGKDGVGITKTDITYQEGTSMTVPPTGTWAATPPTVKPGGILWTRFIWTYSDGTNETGYSVAKSGSNGTDGADAYTVLLTNESHTFPATDKAAKVSETETSVIAYKGTEEATVSSITLGELPTGLTGIVSGNKITFKSATTLVSPAGLVELNIKIDGKNFVRLFSYALAFAGGAGKDGVAGQDGVGLKSTAITYTQSTSGTIAPTTGWTGAVPTLVKGQHLWTRTIWNYTDNTSETGYTVSYNAKDGNNGTNGVAGKDGVGISNTIIEYVGAVSGTSKPTSGWSATIPMVSAGQYLWTRTTWEYTDGTSEQGFINALMGKTGATGPKGDQGSQGVQGLQGPTGTQGIAGPKGTDGKTQYTHIAYANSADGVTNFSTSDSNRAYIGMYVNFNVDDSTTPSDYSWTLVKGADGTQGTPGKAGTDGKTPYLHTAYSWSADGTDRFTTVYPGENYYQQNTPVQVIPSPTSTYNPVITRPNEYANGFTLLGTQDNTGIVRFKNVITGNGWWTVSFWMRGIQEVSVILTINACDLSPAKLTTTDNDTWKKYVYTVNVTNYSSIYNFVDFNNMRWVWYLIKDFKVEQGNTPTPYTPSPLDDPVNAYPHYMGTYTDYTAADSDNPADYTWARILGEEGPKGEDGIAGKDGKGIKATAVSYQASTIGTTAPTGTWSASVPTVAKGSFLWTRTIWTYTDNTTETGYSVAYMGTNGNNGTDGIAGKDGVGIKTTTITYAGSTSGTTAPTTGYTATVPSVPEGQFLWTKTVWTYTDNTTETGYSVAKMGNNGADAYTILLTNESHVFAGNETTAKVGSAVTSVIAYKGTSAITPSSVKVGTLPTGLTASVSGAKVTFSAATTMTSASGIVSLTIVVDGKTFTRDFSYSISFRGATGPAGKPGENGQTPYVHYAWRLTETSAVLLERPTTEPPKYQGVYSDYNKTASTDASKYTWTLDAEWVKSNTDKTIIDTKTWVDAQIKTASDSITLGVKQYTDTQITEVGNVIDGISDELKDMASDSILTPVDKKRVSLEWEAIKSEFPSIRDNAANLGISNTAYVNAYNSLNTYLTGLLNGMSTNSSISPATFKAQFNNYYNEKAKLTALINQKIQGNVDSLGTYKAYAWSPDGSDRFTTVYPRENLLSGGVSFIASNTTYTAPQSKSAGALNLDIDQLNKERTLTVTAYVSVKNSQRIDSTGYFRIGYECSITLSNGENGYIGTWKNGVIGETFSRGLMTTYTLPEGVDATGIRYSGNSNHQMNGDYLEVSQVKIEYGNNPSPIYTPSPLDDPVNAYPTFVGRSIKKSDKPSDYVWEVNPDVPLKKAWAWAKDGSDRFTTVYPGENLVLKSALSTDGGDSVKPTHVDGKWILTDAKSVWPTIPDIYTRLDSSKKYSFSFKIKKTAGVIRGLGGHSQIFETGSQQIYLDGVLQSVTSWPVANIEIDDNLTHTIQVVARIVPNLTGDNRLYIQIGRRGGYADIYSAEIWDLKVEEGQVATVYTPAPSEDPLGAIPKYIGTSQNGGENYSDYTWQVNPDYVAVVADNHISNVKEILESQIDVTAESILNTVSAAYQTTEGANVTEEELRSLIEQTSSSWGVSLEQIQKDLNTVNGDLVEEISTRSDYMRFYPGTNTPILEIGTQSTNGSSAIKLIITNKSIGFVSGEVDLDDPMKNALAYFEADKFKINKGIIVESLRVGNHEMQKMDNGHTIFTFVG